MQTSSNATDHPSNAAWAWPVVLVAVVLAVLLRVSLIVPNLTLVGALALFAGARLQRGWAFLVPLAVMAFSDVLLWRLYGYQPFNLVVYGAFLVYVVAGRWIVADRGWAALVGGALGASLLFFLITNFAVWLSNSLDPAAIPEGQAYFLQTQGSEYPFPRIFYARNVSGLLACYELAIPFFRATLAGDLAFSAALFGVQALLIRSAGRLAREERR